MSASLIKYDVACQAIAEAKAVDEAKDWQDKAAAMEAYARQAKNHALEADAAEIRMRAIRRMDELRRVQKKTVGLNTGTKGQLSGGLKTNPPGAAKPTLASQGIDKNLADKGRKLGAMPDEEFEREIKKTRTRKTSRKRRRRKGDPLPTQSRSEHDRDLEFVRAAWGMACASARRAFLSELGLELKEHLAAVS